MNALSSTNSEIKFAKKCQENQEQADDVQEIEIGLSGYQQQKEVEEIVEAACKMHGLYLVSKNTLQKYPGCVHWHYQRIKTAGTLEITYWPTKNRCWFPLRNGRTKPWVVETVKQLKVEIERQVKEN